MLYHSINYSDNRPRESRDLAKTKAKTVNGWLRTFYRENPNACRGNFAVELRNDGAAIYTKHGKLINVYIEFRV